MRSDAHAREELRAFRFTEQVEQYGGHSALAVVLVVLNPGMMVAVGNRAFADVKAQQLGTALNRQIQGRVFHARLASHHQRNRQRQTGGVHHPVAAETAVGPSEPVAPRTDRALTMSSFERQSR